MPEPVNDITVQYLDISMIVQCRTTSKIDRIQLIISKCRRNFLIEATGTSDLRMMADRLSPRGEPRTLVKFVSRVRNRGCQHLLLWLYWNYQWRE
jgi:hypothetical protein